LKNEYIFYICIENKIQHQFYLLMKTIKPFLLSFILLFSVSKANSQSSFITENPYIESSNTQETQINKIELTDKYTIVYMSFQLGRNANSNGRSGKDSNMLQDILDLLLNGNTNIGGNKKSPLAYISIRPSSSLIALNGDRTFKYIKASGIPEEPNQLDIFDLEKVNFKVYYERVDPGITVFDFFEGDNSDQVKCWNYYKVHITNPSPTVLNKNLDTLKVQPVFFIKGKVLDSKTNKPINAKLEFQLSPSMQAVDSTMTYWNTGSYKTTLPKKGIYNCVVSAQGYLVKQETIELLEANSNNTFTKDIYLDAFEKGDIVRLNSVYFETSQYELLDASFSELNKLVILMTENPTMTILLEGHTDTVGDKNANIELSQKRVNSVKNYLVQKGISAKRIETKGWGSAKPINANGTDEERKVNRRVEFRIVNL
jgi:OmpA-OmpF porin, OOP family